MSTASRVVVARSFEELEPLRGAWERLQGRHFATDPDVFPSILAWQDAVRPHAIALERDGEVHTLVLARVEDIRLTTKVGYAAVYKPKVRALTLVYRGVLGELSDEDAELVLGELRRELATGNADLLRLRALEVGTPLHRAASSATPRALRERSSAAPAHWELAVPDSYDAFLSSLSKSTRESAKRYPKKLEKEFGDRLALEVFRDVADSERVFTDLRRVAEKTYQHGLGVSFARPSCSTRLDRR